MSDFIESLNELINDYRAVWGVVDPAHPVYKYKVKHLSTELKRKLNVVAKFTRNLLFEIVDCKSDEYLRMIFRYRMTLIIIYYYGS